MKNILTVVFLCCLLLKANSQEEYILGASLNNEFKNVVSYDKSGMLSNYLDISNEQFKKVDFLTFHSFVEGKKSDYNILKVFNDSITRVFSLYVKEKVGCIAFDGKFYTADIDLSEFKAVLSKSKEINYFSKDYIDLEEAKRSKGKFKREKLLFFKVLPNTKYEYEGNFTVEVPHSLTHSNESDIIEKYEKILREKYSKQKFDITVSGGGTEVTFLRIRSTKDFFLKFDLYPIVFPFKTNIYATEIFVNK